MELMEAMTPGGVVVDDEVYTLYSALCTLCQMCRILEMIIRNCKNFRETEQYYNRSSLLDESETDEQEGGQETNSSIFYPQADHTAQRKFASRYVCMYVRFCI